MKTADWYREEANKVVSQLASDAQVGLSAAEARQADILPGSKQAGHLLRIVQNDYQ